MTERERILVVDDDPSLLREVKHTLETAGYDVETAVDGLSGLDALDDSDFDLIVLDLRMPRMGGRLFFAELRRLDFVMPVLILSAYGAQEACRELGAEGALSKPFDRADLIATIRSLLQTGGPFEAYNGRI